MSDRYARHELVPGWNQQRAAAATAVVIGVGAVGNAVAQLLALSGIGRLLLCDPDRVEESNLSRTPLFVAADVGRYKVEAAADALARLAPDVETDPRPLPLIHGVGLGELAGASIVLGCLDSRAARVQLAGRCQLVGAAAVDGGTHPWGGEVRPYLDAGGPCYACSLPVEDRALADSHWSCLDEPPRSVAGATAVTAALVGAWMAQIALRFLMGLPCPAGMLVIDGTSGTTRVVEQHRAADCLLHQPIAQPVARLGLDGTATIGDLRGALGEAAQPLAWSPVQERVECRQCGFREERWSLPAPAPCPRCGSPLIPRTTLELAGAPAQLPLRALGIAPREIVAVRTPRGLDWVELG
jgi:molybdopterin/thiamine biosynthesis adenylyltransferase